MSYNIGIDARKIADFGIGTYIRNLVPALGELDQENQYVLFLGLQNRDALEPLPENFRVVIERSPVLLCQGARISILEALPASVGPLPLDPLRAAGHRAL